MDARRSEFLKTAWPLVDGLFAAAMRLSGSRAEAEDLVQETYLHAYQSWDRFEPGTNLRAWLHRILMNGYISSYRRRRRERRALDVERDPTLRAMFLSSDQQSLESDDGGVRPRLLGRGLETALSDLSPEFRTVVVLSDLCDLSYREIADVVGCPIGTVMSRLHRGRRALARKLSAANASAAARESAAA